MVGRKRTLIHINTEILFEILHCLVWSIYDDHHVYEQLGSK